MNGDIPFGTGEGDAVAGPEPPHHLDIVKHDLFAVGVVLGLENEVIGLPTGGKAEADPSVGDVIDHRPFFNDANRMVGVAKHSYQSEWRHFW